MRDHRKLKAFQLADNIVLLTYRNTRNFPKEELFGLTSQMRRSAVSVAGNIVEGCAKASEADYVRFLDIAFGSHRELTYYADLSFRLGFFAQNTFPEYQQSLDESGACLGALINSYRNR